MFNLLDVVRLKNDDIEAGVKKTYKGAIVDVLDKGQAFTVEFFDEKGNTVEKALFKEYTTDQLELAQ